MTFLSQVPQHELRIRAGRMPDGPNTRHRDVMSLFGELPGNAREGSGVLFRLEYLPGRPPSYLIRSAVPPTNPTAGSQTVEEREDELPRGTAVAFRIAVNAVQRTKKTKNGVRPVYVDGALEELVESGEMSEEEASSATEITPWLSEKLAPALVDVRIINHQREVLGRGRQGQNRSKERIAVQVDLIDGIALVEDPKALRMLLKRGVGRAKSYGCGLLTVRPL